MSTMDESEDRAWTVTVGSLSEVLGDVSAITPDTEIAGLGLGLAECTRLSTLLVERAGGFISPSAIVVCTTVDELRFLVERIMSLMEKNGR
jgi:hypothetical protein